MPKKHAEESAPVEAPKSTPTGPEAQPEPPAVWSGFAAPDPEPDAKNLNGPPIWLTYVCARGEGPERKKLSHDIHVQPGKPWETTIPEWALELYRKYPQIHPAELTSAAVLAAYAHEMESDSAASLDALVEKMMKSPGGAK